MLRLSAENSGLKKDGTGCKKASDMEPGPASFTGKTPLAMT